MIFHIESKKHGAFETEVEDQFREMLEKYTWRVAVCRRTDGTALNYVQTNVPTPGRANRQAKLYLHRLIMREKLGRDLLPGEFVDHINGDTLNNRLENLRLCSHKENMRNRRRSSRNSSGFKGVSYHKGAKKCVARISVDRGLLHLGYFATAEAAHAAYCEASRRLHGEFGRTA